MIRLGYWIRYIMLRETYRECDLSPCYYRTTARFHLKGNETTILSQKW
jgi:hypothetical protein